MSASLKHRLDKIQNNTPVIPNSKVRLVTGEIVTLMGAEIVSYAVDGQIQEIIYADDASLAQLAQRLSAEEIVMPKGFTFAE
jgi:hypothetical protein